MTEAKSPREIAEDIEALASRLLKAAPRMASLNMRDADDIVKAANLLSYAAERERLLAEADELISCIGSMTDANAAWPSWAEIAHGEARKRFKSRLSSRPATEGKREDD